MRQSTPSKPEQTIPTEKSIPDSICSRASPEWFDNISSFRLTNERAACHTVKPRESKELPVVHAPTCSPKKQNTGKKSMTRLNDGKDVREEGGLLLAVDSYQLASSGPNGR